MNLMFHSYSKDTCPIQNKSEDKHPKNSAWIQANIKCRDQRYRYYRSHIQDFKALVKYNTIHRLQGPQVFKITQLTDSRFYGIGPGKENTSHQSRK